MRKLASLVLGLATCVFSLAADDLLIADFEGPDYAGWTAKGDAFGKEPAHGKLAGQYPVLDFKGKGLVNTFLNKDLSTGTLTSPPIVLQRRFVHLLVGGGKHPNLACVNLVLADGKVVRTATGTNSERLFPIAWDVSEWLGKTVTLQIVDKVEGGWGHVLVDHILQSDDAAVGGKVRIPLAITGNYLNFPVDDKKPQRYVVLQNEAGAPVTDFRISLAEETPAFWASMDVRAFKGKTVTLAVEKSIAEHSALKQLQQSDELPGKDTIYSEDYRPRFHYSPRVGWVNDPNGMVHYNGVYHFFYQWNPYGARWSNMHWGYATSTDLVHWTDHGAAFTPRFEREAYSGSGVVDWKNTSKLKTGEHPPILLFYTECGERFQEKDQRKTPQRLVYSTDGGATWKEYAKNPIIPPIAAKDGKFNVDRDPIVRWYDPGKHWVMLLFVGGGTFRVFQSPNALEWKAVSDLKVPGHNECPDLFEIAVENDPGVKKWVFVSGAGSYTKGDCAKYVVGSFDGKEFKPEQPSQLIEDGLQNYSTQTFSDAPNGRRIFMAWFSKGFSSQPEMKMPANAQFHVPWELTLYKAPEGYRLRRLPVQELERLRGVKHEWTDLALKPDEPFTAEPSTPDLDILLEIEPGTTGTFALEFSGFVATYDAATGNFTAFGKTVALPQVDGVVKLRVLRDRTMVEIFANDGTVVMGSLVKADPKKTRILLLTEGPERRIRRLTVYEMNSMWK